ncbi:hypothetical protein IQ266_11350 [filamentous cyanobacterium LEGE 11480]|uniref:DUF732 domain-containing protein n=1 Tax=Romeriopsis navalis LEGE 11480 TaxID=2777977 RepID=A0A928VMH4_9CYAN|nr:DUF732 domain-containing protein [Romeriopsis navalis]MBE9030327.1 hypothetical protein [Romeriopsis navalis LEGE 11480]
MKFAIGICCIANLMITARVGQAQTPQPHPDSICYWQSNGGSTIDLSQICGVQNSPRQSTGINLSALDRYPETIQKQLKQSIQTNPKRFLTQAKTTCRVLRYGGHKAAQVRQQALRKISSSAASLARQQVTTDYAIANYCPEFR